MDEKIISVNVEEIMKEIRSNIEKRGETPVVLGFDEGTADRECEAGINACAAFSPEVLHQEVAMANGSHNIEYYQMIPAGGVKSFVKRAIRKVIAFIVKPLRDRQNQFNAYVVRSLNQLEDYTLAAAEIPAKQEELLEKAYQKIDALERRIEVLEQSMKK